MSTIRIMKLAAAISLVGCFHFGPTAETLPLASTPNGATVTASLTTLGAASGELLSVRDDGVVLLRANRLVLVPYAVLRGLRVEKLDDYSIPGGTPSAERRARLNVLSRYPQGINSALQQKLLAQAGQTEIEIVR